MSIHSEALSAIRALREWIKAVPADVAAALPAMPGVEADWLDMVEGELVMFVELEGAHADAHARFRTLMGIPFDESRATQSGDSEEVRKKLPLPYPQGEPGMGGVLLHGTVLVPVEGQDQPQPRAVARMACPMCHGDSGYHRAVPVDGTLPTGNPNVPMTAQYVACARCDGADGVSLDGAHWYREPVFPIGYETQPANGQRIAGLNDQRQNEPQIIPKTISAPLADHIAARGKMVDVKASIGNLTASNLFKLKLLGYEVFQTLSGALTIHKLPDPVSGFGMEGKSWFAVGTFESELGRFVAASYAEAQELALNAFGRAAIPVSERLPEHRQEVLFKVEDLDANGQPKEYGNHGRWLGGRFTLDREFNMHSFSTPGVGWVASHWLPMPPQCVSEGGV